MDRYASILCTPSEMLHLNIVVPGLSSRCQNASTESTSTTGCRAESSCSEVAPSAFSQYPAESDIRTCGEMEGRGGGQIEKMRLHHIVCYYMPRCSTGMSYLRSLFVSDTHSIVPNHMIVFVSGAIVPQISLSSSHTRRWRSNPLVDLENSENLRWII